MSQQGSTFTNLTNMRWMGTPVGGANQLANGIGGIVFSGETSVAGVDQVAVNFVALSLAGGGTATLRVQWAIDQVISTGYPWMYEQSTTFAIAGGVATYTRGISEWTLGHQENVSILLPACAWRMRIGVYASAFDPTDDVLCSIVKQGG